MDLTFWSTPSKLSLPVDEACTRACLYLFFLRGSKYTFQRLKNAVSCSPDRVLPVACYHGRLITGYESIAAIVDVHLISKNTEGSENISSPTIRDKYFTKTYLSWLSQVFCNVTLYFTWVYDPTVKGFTTERVGNGLPWLISQSLLKRKQSQHISYLKSVKWNEKSVSDVCRELDGIIIAVSELLSTGPYLFGCNIPGELDALVYGYWTVFRDFIDVFSPIREIIEKDKVINDLVDRLESYKQNMDKKE